MDFTFQPHTHPILIHNQLVILDEKLDMYVFLNESQTIILTNGDKNCVRHNEIRRELTFLNIIADSTDNAPPLTNASDDYEGIDNYCWRTKSLHPGQRFNLPLTLRAGVDLISLKVALALGGFEYCLNKMRASKKALTKNPAPAWHDSIENYARGIRIASLALPFKVKCLESSMCIFKHAMRNDKNCEFFIGIQLFDFLSHAWVEVDGKVVADDPHLSRKLPKILTI